MDQETAAAGNVDPDAVLTGEALDKAIDISRAEAAANAEAEDATQGDTPQRGTGGADR
jgi:hypothetical protein